MGEASIPLVTPKFDVFHLGQLLWILAESWASGNSALSLKEQLYMKEPCSNGGPAESVVLPRLSESAPGYYRDVVEKCFAENPLDRDPALKLLSLFPRGGSWQESHCGQDLKAEAMGVDAMRECCLHSNYCDHCGKQEIVSLFYTCNICELGDFNACPACFHAGLHCYEEGHLLVEITPDRACSGANRRFYSSVSSSGLRNVIEG
ncbi:hypothetical protein BU26DRAFT_201359 [Trematosphaeria pertusa]|uniref:Protein kinase domain-containing protein n=1 Tax=Trematosphaeria pertusa TaxID=390896 RepID=A0A6A6HS80_9PLEO|nr:uncharacterized protein BU26DRAFT_201359 [Trematosphaeria pertusa]KAF2240857.1 hypothetical protein BU26DRAFT_201359 [Trematosphaeria pertusa]